MKIPTALVITALTILALLRNLPLLQCSNEINKKKISCGKRQLLKNVKKMTIAIIATKIKHVMIIRNIITIMHFPIH